MRHSAHCGLAIGWVVGDADRLVSTRESSGLTPVECGGSWGNIEGMTDPSLATAVTDVQRDRAVEYLQQVYATGGLSDELFEQRLGMALTARTRADLNASLQGLARVAGVFPSAPVVRHPVHDGAQNLGAAFLHLATLPTMFLAPALGRALAPPRSRIAMEASRAMCFQFSALIYGVIASILVASRWAPPVLLLLGFIAWSLMTLWLAIRSVTGEKSTAVVERLMLMRPPEDRG